jgi:hypothetical protein
MAGVPNIFGNATTSIPLTQLDANFNTTATLGNTAIGLGNTTTSVGNLTLTNVTIVSGTSLVGNVTIGNTTVGLGNTATSIGNLALNNATIENIQEPANVVAFAATGTINMDILSNVVMVLTSNAAANWTVNFRGNSGTTFNNAVAVGNAINTSMLVPQGATAYYNSAVTIDGNSVTPKYQGGTAWTAGNANATDTYSYVVIKTAANVYTVLTSQTKFA